MVKFKEKTIRSKIIYRGRVINVRNDRVVLSNGRISNREIVEHSGAVAVVALTRENKVVLIKQYRKPVEQEVLELPAGIPEKGESAAAAARRELEEETGFKAGKITRLFTAYASPGYSSELIKYYLARDLTKTSQGLDADEMIKVRLIPFAKALSLIKKNTIRYNKTILALLFVKVFADLILETRE